MRLPISTWFLLAFAVTVMFRGNEVRAGLAFDDPANGWTYLFDGDSAAEDLDGTWEHDSGSDAWDGSGIGEGAPGGISALTEGAVTFIRMQDTGDPRDHPDTGVADDPSNRKVFLDHDLIEIDGLSETFLDDGFTFSFRARVATPATGPLDDHFPDGGGDSEPWPAEGIGYVIDFDSTTNFSFYQPEGFGSIGFALATPRDEFLDLEQSGLLMNSLNGDFPCADCGDTGNGDINLLPIDSITDWHEYWITIELGGAEGTHVVNVYLDGDTSPASFEVTAGVRADGGVSPLTQGPLSIGFPGTAYAGAMDLDFISFAPGVIPPTGGGLPALRPGDADRDLDFDQLDLVAVQVAAKYLTGNPATWGEGDWNGGPGGDQQNPPAGDGEFNQLDIIAALNAGTYLTGPYAAIASGGTENDGQTSIIYNPGSGEVAVDAPAGTELTSINVDSAGGIFTGDAAANLGGSFDNDADSNIFKATFGGSFGSLSFGNVAQSGLSQDFVLNDLSVVGSLAGGGDLGNVDLIYVPEPSTVTLLALGLTMCLRCRRRQ